MADHTAAAIWFGTPGVYIVHWYSGLVRALLPRVSIWLGTHMVWNPPGPVIVQGYSWLVCALLHSLRLEASLANHMAAVMVRDP